MTLKRTLDDNDDRELYNRPVKRPRHGTKTQLLQLSDELLLRILSYVDIRSLTKCERVSRKLRGLATDDGIWRRKYHDHFLRPRKRRIPKARTEHGRILHTPSARSYSRSNNDASNGRVYASWKQRYKIKNNWTQGQAIRSEIYVGDQPFPPVLARVHGGRLYTANQEHGLRIWEKGVVCHTSSLPAGRSPTALALEIVEDNVWAAIGLDDGMTLLHSAATKTFTPKLDLRGASRAPVNSIAMRLPYLATLSNSNCIDLFECEANGEEAKHLTHLYADANLAPTALSLRKISTTLTASIAYAFNRFNAGWCLGVQEIHMDLGGKVSANRTTSSTVLKAGFHTESLAFRSRSTSTSPFALHPELMRAPTSLSYCGCYILAGLADNTLMVYAVTSTEEKLEINVGRRLWGHTSAVSSVEVTNTGKAVSVSANSDEMRYWELEDILSSSLQTKSSTPIQSHKSLDQALRLRGDGLGLAAKELKREMKFTRRNVSFDEEQAIVVGDCDSKQIISVFNFA